MRRKALAACLAPDQGEVVLQLVGAADTLFDPPKASRGFVSELA